MALDKWEKRHVANIARYEKEIQQIYATAIAEASQMASRVSFDPSKPFAFSDYPLTKALITKLQKQVAADIEAVITKGVDTEFGLSQEKAEELAQSVYSDVENALMELRKQAYLQRRDNAREAFLMRKERGLSLSDRVWRYTGQLKEELEMALDLGLRDGLSADELSREVRKYLNNPNMLFRRVRDEHGVLHLSKRAKAYHPGQGVYRSSYKNARRLTATETNMAYRRADYESNQALDFVVGIRVVLSNNHTLNGEPFIDICDYLSAPNGSSATSGRGCYPKDFKFAGWHPLCRCFIQTILKTPEEVAEDVRRIRQGLPPLPPSSSKNYVGDTPDEFKAWCRLNAGRVERAKNLPYFIRDNREYYDAAFKKRAITPLELAEQRHAQRTPEQAQAIKDRWHERQERYRRIELAANNVLKVAKDYGEVDYALLQQYVDNRDLKGMTSATRPTAQQVLAMKQAEAKLATLIPDAHKWHKQYTIAELQQVYDAVEKKLAELDNAAFDSFKYKSVLEQKKALLEKEIKYVSDPTYLKPHKLYPTWEVSQAAYIRQHAKVIDAIDWQNIDDVLQEALTFETKSKPYLALIDDLQASIAAGDKLKAQSVIVDMQDKRAVLKRAADARERRKFGKSGKGLYDGGDPFTSAERAKLADYEKQIIDGIMNGNGADNYLIERYHDYTLQLSEKYYSKQMSMYSDSERKAMKDMLDRYIARPSTNPSYIWGAELGGVYSPGSSKVRAYMPKLHGLTEEEVSVVKRFTNGSTFSNCYNLRHESQYWRDKFNDKMSRLTKSQIAEQCEIIEEWSQGANYTLDRMVRYNGITFRGLSASGGPELRDALTRAYKSNRPWINNASCSTSMKHSVARAFDGDTILIIHNKTGAYIHAISDYSSEFEIMTLRGAKYKVLAPPKYVGSRYYVELEEII